jgi:protein SCO1/2
VSNPGTASGLRIAGRRCETHSSAKAVGALIPMIALIAGCVSPYAFRGERVAPVRAAPEITGTNWDGTRFQLSNLAGQVVLLFFGYTSCPDKCPLTLAEMKQVYHDLGNRAGEVAVVFVSLDPRRDTRDRLSEYIPAFDERFFGVRVEPEDLDGILAAYDVVALTGDYSDPADSSAGYTIEHTTKVYVVDRAGKLRLTYPFGTFVNDIRSDVLYLLGN